MSSKRIVHDRNVDAFVNKRNLGECCLYLKRPLDLDSSLRLVESFFRGICHNGFSKNNL